MGKTEWGISIMVFIRWTTKEIWEMEEVELEKQRINHINPEILKTFQKTRKPTFNVIRHTKSSAVDLFLVTEDIVSNEGATQTGRGRDTSWVTKHELAGGKCGGVLSGASVLGSTIRYLQALQQPAFTRIITSKIHGSKKCPASRNQTGSHG